MSATLQASTKRASLSGTKLYQLPPLVVGQVIVEWSRFSKKDPDMGSGSWGAEMSGRHVTSGQDRWHVGYTVPKGVVFVAVTLEPMAYGGGGPKETVYFLLEDLQRDKLEAVARANLRL